jgi:hypothetical protein
MLNGISKRCGDDGQEHELHALACEICFGELRYWCQDCEEWIARPACPTCGCFAEFESDPEAEELSRWIIANILSIRDQVYQHLSSGSPKRILGGRIISYIGSSSGETLSALELVADCLRIVIDATCADGVVSGDEIRLIHPFLITASALYAVHRPKYHPFNGLLPARVAEFILFHVADRGAFGYANQETAWSGLWICENVAREVNDVRPIVGYQKSMTEISSRLISLGGITASEGKVLSAIKRRIALAMLNLAIEPEE